MGRRFDHDQIRSLASIKGVSAAARVVGCSEGYARLIASGQVGGDHDQTLSRKAPRSIEGRGARIPAFDHPSIIGGRTMYPKTVFNVDGFRYTVLKSGHNSAKIGKRIQKGAWKGFEVFTLTLEERATCPKSCHHWRSCFGNSMQQAQRIAHGDVLEARLVREVEQLARMYPRGFAVRLHVLGDFYSPRYVQLWAALIEEIPQLHVFGFSARWDYQNDPIAKELIDLALKKWDRFAIRFSNCPIDECSTVSIEHPFQKPADAIVCPAQLGQTASCSTCALCWQSKRRIAFVQH